MGEGRITLTSPNLIMLSEFFEVNYSNGKTTDSKIYVSRNYTNARVFFRKIKNDSKEHEFKYFNYFNIDEKYVETSYDVNYENTIYHVSILDESIVITYDEFNNLKKEY